MSATHAAFDAHNSSMSSTLSAFRDAWHPFCKDVSCDHTNYWDVYGASHQHSLSLVDAGASVQHFHVHVRNRLALELRTQKFLAEHGDKFAKHAYRADAGVHEQMTSYFAQGKDALQRDTLRWVVHEEDASRLLRLFDQDRFAAFVANQPDSSALVQTNAEAEQLAEYGGRRRRRRRVFKVIGDAVVNVVKKVTSFVVSLFKCVGDVKTLAAVGYCKKFPYPESVVGVGVGFGAAVGEKLGTLLQGKVVPYIKVFMGMVVGAIPGSPHLGGVRVGVGIGGNVQCTASSCSLGISVGGVASGLFATNDPNCVFGWWLVGFRCMMGAGVAISVVCCSFDLTNGKENCR